MTAAAEGFSIRQARREELERLRAIEREAGRMFREQPVTLEEREPTPLADLEAARLRASLFAAVDRADRAVGWAMMGEVDGEAHLFEVAVAPDHGRRGIGRSLVEHVCAWAEARGSGAVTLTTFLDVPWNRPFYERCGFVVVPLEAAGSGIRAVVAEEISWGLDWSERCVMRRALR